MGVKILQPPTKFGVCRVLTSVFCYARKAVGSGGL